MQPKLHVSLAGTAPRLSAMGTQIEFPVGSANTGGAWSLLRYTAPPFFEGPQPHFHKVLQETFIVVKGTLTLMADDKTIEAVAGSVVVVPPNMVHKFSNKTDQPVSFLLLMNPGGFEQYFSEIISLRNSEPQWPPADPSKLLELLERFDTYAPVVLKEQS